MGPYCPRYGNERLLRAFLCPRKNVARVIVAGLETARGDCCEDGANRNGRDDCNRRYVGRCNCIDCIANDCFAFDYVSEELHLIDPLMWG